MKEHFIQFFHDHSQGAFYLSILANVLLALPGVIPSFFITAANIIFFGFWKGIYVSFLGEALGAIVSFFLYRKRFKKMATERIRQYPRAERLLEAGNREAFLLILSLRLIPFVPSGLITFAAAIGRVSAGIFILASSLGKLPALLMEAYSVYHIAHFSLQGRILLLLIAAVLIILALRQIKKTPRKPH